MGMIMNGIEFVVGNNDILEKMQDIPAWKPFDEKIMRFCEEFSGVLMKTDAIRHFPDLLSFAFWLRKSNLKKIASEYKDLSDCVGTGLVFHIAPGNMALSFCYSVFTGLLTGNTNIVRLPSRRFEQADIFCEEFRKILISYEDIAQRVCLIKYPHDKAITDELSSRCHMRIIWGGNSTVNTIRQSPIPPRASEITFANRFSICIINADAYLGDYNEKKTAHDFYIDTYLSDQNACSSPRIVFWMGDRIEDAKERFWNSLYEEIKDYEIAPVTSVEKILTFCKYASYNSVNMKMEHDCRIIRMEVDTPSENILDNIGYGGFFYECNIENVEEILPVCSWELQTLAYIGFDGEQLKDFLLSNATQGVDRIVPVGRTMDFSLNWDGKDIVREMTRRIILL